VVVAKKADVKLGKEVKEEEPSAGKLGDMGWDTGIQELRRR
jgi:hypothetical protein